MAQEQKESMWPDGPRNTVPGEAEVSLIQLLISATPWLLLMAIALTVFATFYLVFKTKAKGRILLFVALLILLALGGWSYFSFPNLSESLLTLASIRFITVLSALLAAVGYVKLAWSLRLK